MLGGLTKPAKYQALAWLGFFKLWRGSCCGIDCSNVASAEAFAGAIGGSEWHSSLGLFGSSSEVLQVVLGVLAAPM